MPDKITTGMRLKSVFQGLCSKISCHLIWALIAGLIIDLVVGGILFWQFGLKETVLPPQNEAGFILSQDSLNDFASFSGKKEADFQAANQREFRDIFQ
ncbi:MAG: hypothetical protein M1127_02380 [Patescibacteria group bacterium]|nr:hypothetical protein [Patescibacteria group bacterium]